MLLVVAKARSMRVSHEPAACRTARVARTVVLAPSIWALLYKHLRSVTKMRLTHIMLQAWGQDASALSSSFAPGQPSS